MLHLPSFVVMDIYGNVQLTGAVHIKMNISSLFTHARVFLNFYYFSFFSVEHKQNILKK